MNQTISYCQHGLKGEITIPADKSISHRAVMFASLIKGKTLIKGFSKAQDPLSTVNVCKTLGVEIESINESDIVVTSSGILKKHSQYLNCGNSGTTMRLMSGIVSSRNINCTLIGDESLSKRPMRRIIEPLTKMGAVIYTIDNCSPLYICGRNLHSINYHSQLASAQVKSCVLLAGLNAEGRTTFTEPSLSRNHTELLMSYLNADIKVDGLSVSVKRSQMEPKTIEIPGDMSSAAFFIAAALIVPHSDIILKNVGLNPTRTGLLEVVSKMGGNVEILDKRIVCGETVGDLRVKYSELKGTVIDGDLIPKLIDEIPIIAVMATQAEGTTIVRNAQDLRYKESDRISAVAGILKKLGADITETSDGFIINGKCNLSGGVDVDSLWDHRLAMSAYIAGFLCKNEILVRNFDCVDISFPEFEQYINYLHM